MGAVFPMADLIEFAARACLVSAGSILGWYGITWLLQKGRK
jgi:hypothetical protein